MEIMIDIETLGLDNDAIILSIGAVTFDDYDIFKEFYRTPSVVGQIMLGRTTSESTLEFWENLKIDTPEGTHDIGKTLAELNVMFIENSCRLAWFRGPTFDCIKLETLYRSVGMKPAWEYWQVRDCRTLDNLFSSRDRDEDAVLHNALSDATEQAWDVISFRNNLSSVKSKAEVYDKFQVEIETLQEDQVPF